MRRPPAPEDLYRLRIPTDPQLSPDGSLVAMTVQSVAPGRDGYRHAIWLVAADGTTPARRATLGAKHDTRPRFSPDGRTLAFLSDRRPLVEEEPAAPKGTIYLEGLRSSDELLLKEIHAGRAFPMGERNESRMDALLQGYMMLRYHNSQYWYDSHPLLWSRLGVPMPEWDAVAEVCA